MTALLLHRHRVIDPVPAIRDSVPSPQPEHPVTDYYDLG
jgi:hypothetical protein